MDETNDVEVLPPIGMQNIIDSSYRVGNYLKGHLVSISVGIALGVLICYILQSRKK